MDQKRLGLLLACAIALPAAAWADLAGSPTLSAGQELNISSAVLGPAGGDLQWTGTQVNFLGSAKAFVLSGDQTSAFPNFGLAQAQADASSMTQSPVTSPTVGTVFLMQGNSGIFAKLLIKAQTGTSVQLQFDTFSPPASGPITYTMTGTLQGNVNGAVNLNGNFTWQVMADTSGIFSPTSGIYNNPSIRSYISINGLGNLIPLQNVLVVLNTSASTVTFATGGTSITVPVPGIQFPSNLATVISGVGSGAATLKPGALATAGGNTIVITGVSGGNPPKFGSSIAPFIENIANAATNFIAGTTPAPLAQGSIFVIKGNALGPATLAEAPSGQIFQNTTVSDTSVTVTVGSTTVNALMYYTSNGQLAALLPSNTPTGQGLFTVVYNGVAGIPVGHGIVASNLGLFTVDSTGQGPGIVTFADYSLVSASPGAGCVGPGPTAEPYVSCGAANPGDTLILWATGLGPVNGSDSAGSGLGEAQPNVQLNLYLGGVQVPIGYQGRSGCCIGEDQIVFTLPTTGTLVPTGCAVPLVAQVTNGTTTVSSNTVVIPVASGSRNCTASDPAQVNLQQQVMSGTLPFNYAGVSLSHNSGSSPNSFEDHAKLKFQKVQAINTVIAPFFETYVDGQPLGTCVVYDNLNANTNIPITNITNADAGTSITITGPNNSLVEAIQPGITGVILSSTGAFLTPGTFTVSNGAGGADIGAFKASVNVPATPTWTGPSQAALTAGVPRANGLTVTWTGGSANGVVSITLQSPSDPTFNNGSTATCIAPGSAGTFTVPPYVLGSLGGGALLSLEQDAIPVPITGTGIGLGELDYSGPATNFNAATLQ